MAATLIPFSTLPSIGGRTSNGPTFSIRDNGQISLNSEATKSFDATKAYAVGWDKDSSTLSFTIAKPGADTVQFKIGKQSSAILAFARGCHFIGFDHKAGNFTSPVTLTKTGFSVVLPMGPREVKPKVTRKKRSENAPVVVAPVAVVGQVEASGIVLPA